jgi:type III secretion protein Q
LSSPEEALRAAIAGVLLEPLLAHLATLGLHGVHVMRLVHGTAGFAAHDGAQPIAISFTLDGRQHDVEAVLDTPIVSLVEARAAREPVAIAPVGRTSDEALHDVLAQQLDCVIPGRLVLGSRRLPVDTLRALSPGDVLMRSIMSSLSSLVSDAVAQVTATAVAAWGTPGRVRLHVPVAIDGLNLSIIKEATMTDELDPARLNDTLASDATGSPVDLGELDLPVQFEVDTIALPLSQLCALRPGYVLELQTPVAAAQLKLVTHGQTIGIGELVTVGEHLGVRILKMAHGDDSIQ